MRRFRYRLAAALERDRALELEAARALAGALAELGDAIRAAGRVLARPGSAAAAREFEWSDWLGQAAGRRVQQAIAVRDAARGALLARRRRREALSLHRARCAAAFEARFERAVETELEAANAAALLSAAPAFGATSNRV